VQGVLARMQNALVFAQSVVHDQRVVSFACEASDKLKVVLVSVLCYLSE
jgi:hypothetical protein